MNFGVSNYGTAQELLTLRTVVWDYSPDIVLLAFFTGNDVWDNSKALKHDPDLPSFVLRDDRLKLDDSFLQSDRQRSARSPMRRAARAVIESSRLLQLVRQARGVTQARLRGSGPGTSTRVSEFDPSFYQNPIYRPPTDPDWQAAWRVTERLLTTIRDEAADHGAVFLLATLSTAPRATPDLARRTRLEHELGVADLDYADRRLAAFGARERIAVLNLAPALRARAESLKEEIHGVGPTRGLGHWNERGHEYAGEILGPWLCREGVGTVVTTASRPTRREAKSP